MQPKNWPFISFVIPCFNEEKRVKHLINELTAFTDKYPGLLEYILVNDGSKDSTEQVLNTLVQSSEHSSLFKVLGYAENRGKGYALKSGVSQANGDYLITMDADLSAHPNTFMEWMHHEEIEPKCIYIASREHPDSEIAALEIRRWSGRLFNLWVRWNTGLKIKDTQCGFKCYPSEIGKRLFYNLQTNGWAHDVELLYAAKKIGIPIQVLPLHWVHVDHSKISLFSDGIATAIQIFSIKRKVDQIYK